MARKRYSKVRAVIKSDPKSALKGRAWFTYKITAEGAGFKVISFVRGLNKGNAELRFRKHNKMFRHEVRMIGADASEWPITIERQ